MYLRHVSNVKTNIAVDSSYPDSRADSYYERRIPTGPFPACESEVDSHNFISRPVINEVTVYHSVAVELPPEFSKCLQ